MSEDIKSVDKSLEKKILKFISNNVSQVKRGANEVTKMVDRSKTLLVIIAADTKPIEMVGHLPVLCNDKDVPFVYVESSQTLGMASGLQRGIAACCVIYRDEREYDKIRKGVGYILADLNGVSCE